jgi:hypothetical protein
MVCLLPPALTDRLGEIIMHRKRLCLVLLSCMLLCIPAAFAKAQPSQPAAAGPSCDVVVLAVEDDPYYPLAQEIAAVENAQLAHSFKDALACQPRFLLWVVSPKRLSDAAMLELGLALQRQNLMTAPGIITASSLEGARALWLRRSLAGGESVYAANAPNPAAHLPQGELLRFAPGAPASQPLTRQSFAGALQSAAYLTFTGHGSSTHLRLAADTLFTAADVPALHGLAIETGSCQTLRPWREDSIALRFIDRGAAAYAGFVFSPNEGYLIGEFDGLPWRYTWPGFTIGQALLVQNRGARQGFAALPFLMLLGDPRGALQSEPPYELVEDRPQGEARILRYENAPAGVIPLRIAGGAAYRFVVAPGITAAADADPFYNSRLQMVDIGADKYILQAHPGGELALRLQARPPWYWYPLDVLLDSLDHTFIFTQQSGGDRVALAFAGLPLLWLAWQALRKRVAPRKLRLALVWGAAFAALQALYVLLRLQQVTITSKAVVFSPLSIAAAFLLASAGALLYFQARSPWGKLAGMLVVTFPSWSAMAFGLLAIAAFNLLAAQAELGVALYNDSIGLLPAGGFFATGLFSVIGLRWVGVRADACSRSPSMER